MHKLHSLLLITFIAVLYSCVYEDAPELINNPNPLAANKDEISVYSPARYDTIFFEHDVKGAKVVTSVFRNYSYKKEAEYGLQIIHEGGDYVVVEAQSPRNQSYNDDGELHAFLVYGTDIIDTLVLQVATGYTFDDNNKYTDKIVYTSSYGRILAIDEDGKKRVNLEGTHENDPISINHEGPYLAIQDGSYTHFYYTLVDQTYRSTITSYCKFSRGKSNEIGMLNNSYYTKSLSFQNNLLEITNLESHYNFTDFSFTENKGEIISAIYKQSISWYNTQNYIDIYQDQARKMSIAVENVQSLSISRDGTMLVYTEQDRDSPAIGKLVLYNLKTQTKKTLQTSNSTYSGFSDVAFNAEGTKIAFLQEVNGYNDIFVMSLSGNTNPVNITNSSSESEGHLDWN